MSRALLTAPVARDLAAEYGGNVVRVPGATNGTLQAWDTLDEAFYVTLADPQITVYPTIQSIPTAIKRYLVQFLTADNAQGTGERTWLKWQDCDTTHFIRVRNAGVTSIKRVTNLQAGDRPLDFELMHHWLGNVQDTLGAA